MVMIHECYSNPIAIRNIWNNTRNIENGHLQHWKSALQHPETCRKISWWWGKNPAATSNSYCMEDSNPHKTSQRKCYIEIIHVKHICEGNITTSRSIIQHQHGMFETLFLNIWNISNTHLQHEDKIWQEEHCGREQWSTGRGGDGGGWCGSLPPAHRRSWGCAPCARGEVLK